MSHNIKHLFFFSTSRTPVQQTLLASCSGREASSFPSFLNPSTLVQRTLSRHAQAKGLSLFLSFTIIFPYFLRRVSMPRLVDTGREGADTEASSAGARQDGERERASRCLTFELNSPILEELDTAGVTDSLDYTTFRQLCEEHPDILFNSLYEYLNKLEMKAAERNDNGVDEELVQDQEVEIAELKKRVKERRNAMAELIQDRDDALTRVQELTRETESPSIAPGSQKKTSKLPDGKRFSDGKDPTFESWLIDIEKQVRDKC